MSLNSNFGINVLFQAFNSKSPTNGTGTMRIGSSKPYRHISLMPLSTVKRVVDIREAEGKANYFPAALPA